MPSKQSAHASFAPPIILSQQRRPPPRSISRSAIRPISAHPNAIPCAMSLIHGLVQRSMLFAENLCSKPCSRPPSAHLESRDPPILRTKSYSVLQGAGVWADGWSVVPPTLSRNSILYSSKNFLHTITMASFYFALSSCVFERSNQKKAGRLTMQQPLCSKSQRKFCPKPSRCFSAAAEPG